MWPPMEQSILLHEYLKCKQTAVISISILSQVISYNSNYMLHIRGQAPDSEGGSNFEGVGGIKGGDPKSLPL